MMAYLPDSATMADFNAFLAGGAAFGLGVSLAFWAGGYVVRSLLRYFEGGL